MGKHANTKVGLVDLRTANAGDTLISYHGEKLTYIRNTGKPPFPHTVQYSDGSSGSRTDDGFVGVNFRLASDHDIVSIIHNESD
jgi:hypothetical protein